MDYTIITRDAITYERTAVAGMEGEISMRNQEFAIDALCEGAGLRIVQRFQDIGSGLKPDLPSWKKMIEYLEANKGKVCALVVFSPDRISRSTEEAIKRIEMLERKYKIKVLEVQSSKLLNKIESIRRSEKIKMGIQMANRKKGTPRQIQPYIHKKKKGL